MTRCICMCIDGSSKSPLGNAKHPTLTLALSLKQRVVIWAFFGALPEPKWPATEEPQSQTGELLPVEWGRKVRGWRCPEQPKEH